jgi:DNA-binding beta-propeller fold protein YncE
MYDDLYLFTLHDRLVLGACDIFGGTLLFVDASTGAQIAKTPLETFHAPSAWAIDPVTSQIIVTNKGVVRMHDYNWGDYVSATVWNCA